MNPVKIWGREQAAWLMVVASAFQVLMSYGLDADGKVQGIVTACVVFLFSVVTAVRNGDGIVAVVSGVAVALFALFAAFGWEWSAEAQTNWLALITVGLGFFQRQLTTSPTPASVSPPGKLVA